MEEFLGAMISLLRNSLKIKLDFLPIKIHLSFGIYGPTYQEAPVVQTKIK